jgi:hypothetical protein
MLAVEAEEVALILGITSTCLAWQVELITACLKRPLASLEK